MMLWTYFRENYLGFPQDQLGSNNLQKDCKMKLKKIILELLLFQIKLFHIDYCLWDDHQYKLDLPFPTSWSIWDKYSLHKNLIVVATCHEFKTSLVRLSSYLKLNLAITRMGDMNEEQTCKIIITWSGSFPKGVNF